MMEHLQIWIFKRSIHKMLLLSTRTLRYYNIGGVGGGLCWSSIGCRRDRITANYCPNQTNLQQFVPTVYYVTRAAEVGRACDGSVLCVCLWRYMLDQWEVCY